MASTIASHRGATLLSLVYGKWFLLALFLFQTPAPATATGTSHAALACCQNASQGPFGVTVTSEFFLMPGVFSVLG